MSYIPPNSYFYNNGRNPYLNGNVLPEAAPRRVNPYWTKYGLRVIILGLVLILLGIAMIPLEVTRIIQGSLNRLTTGSYILYPNYNWDLHKNNPMIIQFAIDVANNGQPDLANKGIVPFSAISANNVNNFPIQDKYLWPWSHAALLFSLIIIACGILGVVSGFRGTYSSLFAFFTLALLSALLCSFLIAYFATHIYWQININIVNRLAFFSHNLDFSLGLGMLILSSLALLLTLVALVVSCLALGIFRGHKSPLIKVNQKLPDPNDPSYFRENPFLPPPGFVPPRPYLS